MDFYKAIKKSDKVQALSKKIRGGKGELDDVNKLAQAISEVVGKSIAEELNEGDSVETVASVLAPTLRAAHEYLQNMTTIVINKQYQAAGVGLRAQKAEMKADRTENTYARIAEVIRDVAAGNTTAN